MRGDESREDSNREREAALEALAAAPEPLAVAVATADQGGGSVAEADTNDAGDHGDLAGRELPAVSVAIRVRGRRRPREGAQGEPQRDGAADQEKDVGDDDGAAEVAAIDIWGEEGRQRFREGRELAGAQEVQEEEEYEDNSEGERNEGWVNEGQRQEHGDHHKVEDLPSRVDLVER